MRTEQNLDKKMLKQILSNVRFDYEMITIFSFMCKSFSHSRHYKYML